LVVVEVLWVFLSLQRRRACLDPLVLPRLLVKVLFVFR
jgi:hypothetical protein